MKLVASRKADQNVAAVDPWTLVHFSMGLATGLMDIPASWSVGVAVGYELVEQYTERQDWGQDLFATSRPEVLPNAAVDVAVFAVGHWLGRRWNGT